MSKQLLDAAKGVLALHDNEVFVAEPWMAYMEDLRQAIAAAEQAQQHFACPSAEQLYTMVTSRFQAGTFPWSMVSESGKAAWSAAAAELVFAPDTIMASHTPQQTQQPAVAVLRDWPKLLEMARQIIRDGHVHDVGGGDLAVTTCEAFEGLDDFLKKNFPEPLGELTGQERKWLEAEAAIQPPFVPDGYALVPVEPTPEMLKAADKALMTPLSGMERGRGPVLVYSAMLAAAQKGGE